MPFCPYVLEGPIYEIQLCWRSNLYQAAQSVEGVNFKYGERSYVSGILPSRPTPPFPEYYRCLILVSTIESFY